MASYPTTVKTFTTRNTGDVIQAAHVNDLQDEVNAVESGLLTGTARLNSSNSTVANLSVAGGCTLAGAWTLSAPQSAVITPQVSLVYLDAVKDLGSSAASTVLFNINTFMLSTNFHDQSSSPGKLLPLSTGIYKFTAQFTIAGVASTWTYIQADILDSSNGNIGISRMLHSTIVADVVILVSGYKYYPSIDGLNPSASTHYCVARIVQPGNSTTSLSSGIGNTWFAAERVCL